MLKIGATQRWTCSGKLDGQNKLPKVIEGVKFTDGIETVRDHATA